MFAVDAEKRLVVSQPTGRRSGPIDLTGDAENAAPPLAETTPHEIRRRPRIAAGGPAMAARQLPSAESLALRQRPP